MGTDLHGLRVSLASPCAAAWSGMAGSGCVRQCGLCQRRVYDVSAIDRVQIDALTAGDGPPVFVRADGTRLARDCPLGSRLAARAHRRKQLLAMAAVAVALALGVPAISQRRDTSRLSATFEASQRWSQPVHDAIRVDCVQARPSPPPPSTRRGLRELAFKYGENPLAK